ncbi:MAG: hypothetical protein ACJA0Y_000350, partial [Maricaulis maris]
MFFASNCGASVKACLVSRIGLIEEVKDDSAERVFVQTARHGFPINHQGFAT